MGKNYKIPGSVSQCSRGSIKSLLQTPFDVALNLDFVTVPYLHSRDIRLHAVLRSKRKVPHS